MARGLFGLLTALVLLLPGQSLAQPAAAAVWQPGPNAAGDNTFSGAIDSPGNGATLPGNRLVAMRGWFVDTTAEGWAGVDDVQVFLGTMDGGTLLTHASIGLNRPDVAASLANPYWAASGWSATLDTGGLPAGQGTLSAYVHTPSKGFWFTQVSVTVGASTAASPALTSVSGPQIAGPPPLLTVSTLLDGDKVSNRLAVFKINGTVRDPLVGPKAIDWVSLWLNGEQNTDGAVFLGEPPIDSDGAWSFDFSPWKYPAITSNLYVYAHSDVTSKVTLKVVHFIITDRPA